MNYKVVITHINQMIKESKATLLICCAFFFIISSFAQEVQIATDTTSIKIGEELKLTLSVEVAPADLVVFPETKSMGLLEVIASYKIDTLRNAKTYILNKEYGLTQFDSGHYVIPQQKININGKSYSSDSLQIEVRDVVVDTTKQKLYDIKPIIAVTKPAEGFPTWIIYVLIGVLVLAGVLYMIFFRKSKSKRKTEQKLPPFEDAIQHLTALDSNQLLENHEYKKYYSELTDVLKRYLDEKVYDNALESTSDELIERLELLRDSGKLPISKNIIVELTKVLRTSDLVKFAKSQPDDGTAKVDRRTIEKVLHETKEAIPEPTEEELLLNEQYQKELERKNKQKKIIYASITGVALIVLIVIGFGIKYGFSTVKDEVFGHPTKSLLEGKWVRSAYGNPPIVITTPQVLKRVSNKQLEAANTQSFAYGSLTSNFGIVLNTTIIPESAQGGLTQTNSADADENEKQKIDLEHINEMSLQLLEQQGATDLVVKQEEYDNGKEFTGMKAFGTLNIKNPITNTMQSAKYEILSFQQGNALQQIMIFYQEDDMYAGKIASQILDSIELKKTEE
ncbi:MAG: BatD family protein [Flavobacteriaceae bacterium]